jgi:hypothetical protein
VRMEGEWRALMLADFVCIVLITRNFNCLHDNNVGLNKILQIYI